MAIGSIALVLAGVGSTAYRATAEPSDYEIKVNLKTGEMQQRLPDVSHEPHDEAALRAEMARQTECLEANGYVVFQNELTFEGGDAFHNGGYKADGSVTHTKEQQNAIDLKCSARMSALMSEYGQEYGG